MKHDIIPDLLGTIRSHLTDAIRTHVTQHGIPAPPWYGGGLIVPVAPLDFFSMSADPYVIYAGLYGRTEQPLTHITRDDKGRLEEHILLAVILTGKQISFLTANEDARQEIADYEMRAEELLNIRDLLDEATSASTRDWLVFNAAVYLYGAGKGLRIWSRFDGEYHPEHEPIPCPMLTQINDNNDAAIRERLLEELSAGGKDPVELVGDDTIRPKKNDN